MENFNDLSSDLQKMMTLSKEVRDYAYSPFSNFKVGAALLCNDGTIYTGCNVENSSYSLTICAERSAVVKAVSEGKLEFKAIGVCAVYKDDFVYPCGACRQVLTEFGNSETFMVYTIKPNDMTQLSKSTLTQLLPNSFNLITQNSH